MPFFFFIQNCFTYTVTWSFYDIAFSLICSLIGGLFFFGFVLFFLVLCCFFFKPLSCLLFFQHCWFVIINLVYYVKNYFFEC